jgi:hypothetical protein
MKFTGGCHCGNIGIAFTTELEPADIDVRACQCSFCLKHNTRAITDPNGTVLISVDDPSHLVLYAFGLKTASYVLCGRCGGYVAAITNEEPQRATVIANALQDGKRFSKTPIPVTYDTERREAKIVGVD